MKTKTIGARIMRALQVTSAMLAGVVLAYALPRVLAAYAPLWLGLLYSALLGAWIVSVLMRASGFSKPAPATLTLVSPDDAHCFSNGMHVVVSSEDGSRG